jgi:hypothetical protein
VAEFVELVEMKIAAAALVILVVALVLLVIGSRTREVYVEVTLDWKLGCGGCLFSSSFLLPKNGGRGFEPGSLHGENWIIPLSYKALS